MKNLFLGLMIAFLISFTTFAENYTSVFYDNVFDYYYSPDGESIAIMQDGKIVKDGVVLKEYYEDDKYMGYSPDGKIFVYAAKKSEEESVMVMNGVEGEAYKRIYSFKFSPDSKHIIYQAQKLNGKYVYVYDGVESKEYEGISNGDIFFSDNSASYAVIMGKHNDYTVIVNGEETPKYGGKAFISSFTFSSDGKNYAYVGNIFDLNDWILSFSNGTPAIDINDVERSSFLIENGIKLKDSGYLEISVLGYMPNTSKLIYSYKGNVIVGDKTESGIIDIESIIFDKKTGSYVYISKNINGVNIVENGKPGKTYYYIDPYSINYNNGKLQYLARKEVNGNMFFVKNGEEKDLGYKIINQFYSNGESIFFVVFLGDNKYKVSYNGKESIIHNRVPSLDFSDDFKHFVYSIRDVNNVGVYTFYKDLEQVVKVGYEIIGIVISPDGKSTTIIYKDRDNNYFIEKDGVVVDESKYEPFSVRYSPDSKKIAYRIDRKYPLDDMPRSYPLIIVKPITEESNIEIMLTSKLTLAQKRKVEEIVKNAFDDFKKKIEKIKSLNKKSFIIVSLQAEIDRVLSGKSLSDVAKYAIFYLNSLVSDEFLNSVNEG